MLTALLAGCAQPDAHGAGRSAPSQRAEWRGGSSGAAGAPGAIVPGGTWTDADGADASILNPILWSDSASSGVGGYLFPGLIGVDHETGAFTPEGAMAESWEVSADGLTWTFHLRDGIKWSDGDPVDANDFKFTYDAIASDLVETPRKSAVEKIASIEVVDPLTLKITLTEVKCDALGDLGLGWLPSHLYKPDFSDIMENPYNAAPPVSAGPFTFQSWARDDNIILVRNEDYWEGAPNMDGRITRIVPDSGARLAQLLSGEIDVTGLEPSQLTSVQGNPEHRCLQLQRRWL